MEPDLAGGVKGSGFLANRDGLLVAVTGGADAQQPQAGLRLKPVFGIFADKVEVAFAKGRGHIINMQHAASFKAIVDFVTVGVEVANSAVPRFHHRFGKAYAQAGSDLIIQKFADQAVIFGYVFFGSTVGDWRFVCTHMAP